MFEYGRGGRLGAARQRDPVRRRPQAHPARLRSPRPSPRPRSRCGGILRGVPCAPRGCASAGRGSAVCSRRSGGCAGSASGAGKGCALQPSGESAMLRICNGGGAQRAFQVRRRMPRQGPRKGREPRRAGQRTAPKEQNATEGRIAHAVGHRMVRSPVGDRRQFWQLPAPARYRSAAAPIGALRGARERRDVRGVGKRWVVQEILLGACGCTAFKSGIFLTLRI